MPGGPRQTPIAIRLAALAPFARFLFAHVASDPSRAEPFAGTRPTRRSSTPMASTPGTGAGGDR